MKTVKHIQIFAFGVKVFERQGVCETFRQIPGILPFFTYGERHKHIVFHLFEILVQSRQAVFIIVSSAEIERSISFVQFKSRIAVFAGAFCLFEQIDNMFEIGAVFGKHIQFHFVKGEIIVQTKVDCGIYGKPVGFKSLGLFKGIFKSYGKRFVRFGIVFGAFVSFGNGVIHTQIHNVENDVENVFLIRGDVFTGAAGGFEAFQPFYKFGAVAEYGKRNQPFACVNEFFVAEIERFKRGQP